MSSVKSSIILLRRSLQSRQPMQAAKQALSRPLWSRMRPR